MCKNDELTVKGDESQRPKSPNAFVGRLGIAVAVLPLLSAQRSAAKQKKASFCKCFVGNFCVCLRL